MPDVSQAGHNAALTNALDLKPPEQFRYIMQGANISVNYKSATSFNSTLEAFDAIGIRGTEREDIFRVLAAVLHLGNIRVLSTSDGSGPTPDAYLREDDATVVSCSRMLGCSPSALVNALVIRNIQVGVVGGAVGSGEVYTVSQTQQQAEDARDAMSRVLYGGLFDALVLRINKSFGFLPGVKLAGTISILDIFGFEHFKSNHFEQFCINYANEKLQVVLGVLSMLQRFLLTILEPRGISTNSISLLRSRNTKGNRSNGATMISTSRPTLNA